MKNWFAIIFCQVLSFTAGAYAQTPKKFRLHVNYPHAMETDISIHFDPLKKDYVISDQHVESVVVEHLFKKLWSETPPLESWPNSEPCFNTTSWSVHLDGQTKKICQNKKIIQGLKNFEKSLSLILRPRL